MGLLMKIINIHRRKTKNIGDLMCAPCIYFPSMLGDKVFDILAYDPGEEADHDVRVSFQNDTNEADLLVVGGGGLLEIDFFSKAIERLVTNKRSSQKLIVWGAGHNAWSLRDWRDLKPKYKSYLEHFNLVGVRDHGTGYQWVPCVSCMHPTFDRRRPIIRDVGLFINSEAAHDKDRFKILPKGIALRENDGDFDEVIEFLGTSELVITDSFHGAYWATLLGRKVIAFPSSSKFYDLKHPVPLCAPADWERYSSLARSYENALFECRQANIDFATRVHQLIEYGTHL